MWWCTRCNEYHYNINKNDCPATAYVIIDQYEEEHTIYAMSEYDAAIKYARWYNERGDYDLMNDEQNIKVNGKPYVVSAEPDIHYSVKEL